MKYFSWGRRITKNKNIEIEITLFPKKENCWNLYNFLIQYSLKGDHCGFKIEIEIYKLFWFIFNFYDTRHWDWKKDKPIINKQTQYCNFCHKFSNRKFYFDNQEYCENCIDELLETEIYHKIGKIK